MYYFYSILIAATFIPLTYQRPVMIFQSILPSETKPFDHLKFKTWHLTGSTITCMLKLAMYCPQFRKVTVLACFGCRDVMALCSCQSLACVLVFVWTVTSVGSCSFGMWLRYGLMLSTKLLILVCVHETVFDLDISIFGFPLHSSFQSSLPLLLTGFLFHHRGNQRRRAQ